MLRRHLDEMKEQVLVDEMYGRVFELPLGQTVIGRSDECDVTLPRGSIAPRHAVITNHGDELTLRDNRSTNGTFLRQPAMTSPTRLGLRPVTVEAGDAIRIGPGQLVIRPADWVGDAPPASFPAAVSDRSHEVLEAIRAGELISGFSAEELDSAWVAAYSKWRALPPSGGIFDLATQLCSPRMLIAIRDALDDPVRWFVDFGLAGVDTLLDTDYPIGFLLALDVRLRHSGRGFREAAGRGLRKTAQRQSSSISRLSTERFLEVVAATNADTDHRLFEKLACNIIESARKEGRTWTQQTWTELMNCRAFATVAASFVFVARDRGEYFRPENGELLGLDAPVEMRPSDEVGVALEVDAAWSEHLADYEIVQPFTQQI